MKNLVDVSINLTDDFFFEEFYQKNENRGRCFRQAEKIEPNDANLTTNLKEKLKYCLTLRIQTK